MSSSDAEFGSLEEERNFLLESLRDLEREYAAGDVDYDDYVTLRDGYIARTAALTREIGGELVATSEEPKSRNRLLKIVAGSAVVVLIAIASGWWVASQSGQRLPGQSASGGIELSSSVRLSLARSLNFSDPAQAIQLYSEVLKIEPDNVEALTYRSWLLALSAAGASDDVKDVAYATAIQDMSRAIEVDSTYPDPHCFLGIIFYRILDDPARSEPFLATCKSLNPPHEVLSYVTAIVDDVQNDER
jgi:tetratricopeptide (TPR) repeat protein